MRGLLVFALAVVCSAACSPSAERSAVAPTGGRPGTGALDLRDASATELVAQLALALGTPVIVDTEAVPLTRCARVTLVAPPGTPRTQLVLLARDVLRTAALSLEEREGHLVVARIPDIDPPADCPRIPRARTGTDPLEVLPTEPYVPPDPGPPVEGIRLLSENTYEVDPDAAIFADGAEGFTRAARILPHTTDGQVDGIRLYGIRRQSLLGSLGFQNGDTVTAINDRPISSPDAALEAYSDLRTAERVVVDVMRRGAPLTLTYIRRQVVRGTPPSSPGRREASGTPVP